MEIGSLLLSNFSSHFPQTGRRSWRFMMPVLLLLTLFSVPLTLAGENTYPGDRAGATKLLNQFLNREANYRALTLTLKPRKLDYEAVYMQPLARRLQEAHEPMWANKNSAIRPKKDQTEILLTMTTTDSLIAKGWELGQFPGGYKDVVAYLKPGVTIARFKFVEPGKTLGMAFDGLVHVNGRWVFIPKPWRALP